MRNRKVWFFLGLFLTFAIAFQAEAKDSRVALLDLTARTGETDSKTFALQHALEVAGVPYVITTSPKTATAYSIIVSCTRFSSTSLKGSERSLLTGYVAAGGVLVVPEVLDSRLFPLFGLSAQVSADTRHLMTWNTASGDYALHWFDEPNEITISLGKASYVHVIPTTGYTTAGASALAYFDDGSAAVAGNRYGSGFACALGFSFKELILRNQLNRDFNAQRTYSNGFEPTSDTIIFFLRGIYESVVPFAVFKHTSPDTSRAALIITHDVDATSAMNMMEQFASMESARGVAATYNITTHYFRDALSSDYYTANKSRVADLLLLDHNIGSHSVGHFPDWADENVFPVGFPGETRNSYHPYYANGVTTGGTVYGELEVSRSVLEEDTGASVQTFRSGYLYWNKTQINVLDALGYKYDSSVSANDVLTNFPYRCRYDTSYHGTISNVFEIPMTISDAQMSSADVCPAIVLNWLDIIEKNGANGAPTVLLVHPNRDYKLIAEESLLDQMPTGFKIMDMDSFGDFWRARDGFKFRTELQRGNRLVITVAKSSLPVGRGVSLIVKGGKGLSTITVRTENGTSLQFNMQDWQGNDVILYSFR